MTWVLWAALAAAIAIPLEVVFRGADRWALWMAVPAVALNYTLYRTVHNGPTLIVAVAAFNLATVVLRALASQWWLHEPVVKGNLAAAVMLALAVVIGRLWR